MSDDVRDSGQPEFEDHLQDVMRRRRQRIDEDALADDRVDLSSGVTKKNVFASGGGRVGDVRDDGHLLWTALGLGGAALLITLVMGMLLYRQGGRITQLQESVAILEEQVETQPGQTVDAGLQADIAQLNARLNAMEGRLSQLIQANARQEGTASVDGEGEDRILQLQERVDRLQKKVTELARKAERSPRGAVSGKSGGASAPAGGWYVMLASLGDRAAAEKLQKQYRRKGVEAEIQEATVKGRRRYRLRVGPFVSMAAARQQAARIKSKLGLRSVWLSR